MKVLHFKTNYLNISEIFINRFVRNSKKHKPIIATCNALHYTEGLPVYEMPKSGWQGLRNNFHLSLDHTPPFLYDVVKQEQPDILHGHFAMDAYRLLGLQRKSGCPLILNFYGYDVLRLPRQLKWKLRYQYLKRRADMILVGSEDMKRNVTEMGFPTEKIRVLKLGMDIHEIEFRQRTEAGPKLMMIGRLVEKKGFEYAISAVKLLHEKGYEAELDIYGDGILEQELRKQVASLGLEQAIHFNGQTENSEIMSQLYKHDILLVPSVQAKDGDREGIPQTTIEGMATGIPVVASDHAGLPEQVIDRETGMLVPERDSQALANAIQELRDDADLVATISKGGRERSLQEHHIHTQVEKLESYYSELL